jgi:hypothetical protein
MGGFFCERGTQAQAPRTHGMGLIRAAPRGQQQIRLSRSQGMGATRQHRRAARGQRRRLVRHHSSLPLAASNRQPLTSLGRAILPPGNHANEGPRAAHAVNRLCTRNEAGATSKRGEQDAAPAVCPEANRSGTSKSREFLCSGHRFRQPRSRRLAKENQSQYLRNTESTWLQAPNALRLWSAGCWLTLAQQTPTQSR